VCAARSGRGDRDHRRDDGRIILAVIASSHTLRLRTRGNGHIVDLTGNIQAAVADSAVQTGQAIAMVVGSTAALTTLEYEPGLVEHDLVDALERIAPEAGRYVHEETWHDDNGHSHVRAALIGPSLALPVVDGRVPLGTWQQLVLVDLDTRPRDRTVVLTVVGAAD
jgi:secondary thiamine-phosphate synthase enzyme